MISPTIRASILPADKRGLIRSLIGKPYAAGADGPTAFDCYGLVRFVLRSLFSIALPESRHAPILRRAWRRCWKPVDGSIVLMGMGDKHIGIVVSGGVLHALDGVGVVFDDFLSLRFRGFDRIRIYRPA